MNRKQFDLFKMMDVAKKRLEENEPTSISGIEVGETWQIITDANSKIYQLKRDAIEAITKLQKDL